MVMALVTSLLAAQPITAQTVEVIRIPLSDTVDVAVDYARTAFAEAGAERVLLGRRDLFADSLAGGGLAGGGPAGTPLLLTDGGFLSDAVSGELDRLGATTVTVLGGTAAVSDEVTVHLGELGYTVERVAGETRIETAIAIAETIDSSTAIVARAFPAGEADPTQAFADSLPAGAWAAETAQPVLLTQTEVLTAATRDHIAQAGYDTVTIVGGTAAVSQAVEDELAGLVGTVTRVAGPTRFDTAVAVNAARGLTVPDDGDAIVISEGQSADAWSAGFAAAPYATSTGAAMVFTSGTTVPPATRTFLDDPAVADGDTTIVCSAHPLACAEAEQLLGLDTQAPPPIEVLVDPGVGPRIPALPLEDGTELTLGAASDGAGGQVDSPWIA